MMVTLLVWAYANGITSSRRIERLCGQDVAFRVICAGRAPDHVTMARFRQQFADTAAGLFAQVLVLCARLGMGQVGVVALDGTKIAANASKDANRTEDGLRKLAAEMAARARRGRRGGGRACSGRGGAATTTPATRTPGRSGSPRRWRRWRPSGRRGRRRSGPRRTGAWRRRGPGPRGRGARPAAAEVALAEAKRGPGDRRLPGEGRGQGGGRRLGAPAARRDAARSRREEYCRVREARAELERARARAAARARPAAAGGKKKKRRERGAAERHRPGLAADARARRRVHPGLQPAERHQRGRPRHRHPAHELDRTTCSGTSR